VADTDTTLEVVTKLPADFKGWATLQVKVNFGSGEYITVPVSLSVRRFAPVLISRNRISQGDHLNENDFFLQREEVTNEPADVLTDVKDILGKAAKTTIPANEIVCASMLDKQRLIKKNEMVTVMFDTDLISITMKALAMENGREGDVIQVRNMNSRKIFDAQVVSNTLVRAVH
jgi:flagella basal body P-ring formation protein FlgA